MKTAILCAQGLGDGLLMMIAHRALKAKGYEVTFFHDKKEILAPLFPDVSFSDYPGHLDGFDLVLIQNDNSKRCWDLMRTRDRYPHLVFFYPTPCKGGQKGDITFDAQKPIAWNIAQACSQLFDLPFDQSNGIKLPQQAIFQREKKRIAIHPTSADVKRNWLPNQYVKLAQKVQKKGFQVAFTVSQDEYPYWEFVKDEGIELPLFASLEETAHFLYESAFFIGNDSGLGHLASNLGIPTLSISGNRARLKLWRPNWAPSQMVTPPFPLPNFKGINLRLRESFWQICVPTPFVYHAFIKAYERHCPHSL